MGFKHYMYLSDKAEGKFRLVHVLVCHYYILLLSEEVVSSQVNCVQSEGLDTIDPDLASKPPFVVKVSRLACTV
jgi:hypothetical protein